jgi:Uma2 family endonuclease
VEIVSPSNRGKVWEDNLAFYHEAGFPEFWLVQMDGSVATWRSVEPNVSAVCKPGELFSSQLFSGLAIDPAWIVDYPDEINFTIKFGRKSASLGIRMNRN